ncbi:MAG: hypothetical protein D6685_13395 [Bacteroidetes bacterium]|nr:MAG: hypothetical protein D6685_13395 [Bacteroidota bacterium]
MPGPFSGGDNGILTSRLTWGYTPAVHSCWSGHRAPRRQYPPAVPTGCGGFVLPGPPLSRPAATRADLKLDDEDATPLPARLPPRIGGAPRRVAHLRRPARPEPPRGPRPGPDPVLRPGRPGGPRAGPHVPGLGSRESLPRREVIRGYGL